MTLKIGALLETIPICLRYPHFNIITLIIGVHTEMLPIFSHTAM